LAVAFTSPGSVVTVIVLLSMSSGLRRAIAFICGWLLSLGVLAVLMAFVLHGQDFSSRHTTPSRTASSVEVLLGCLLLTGSVRAYRRPRQQTKSQSPPKWLDRIDRTHWLLGVAVGAFMCSYALSLAAGAEILKAKVGTLDAAALGPTAPGSAAPKSRHSLAANGSSSEGASVSRGSRDFAVTDPQLERVGRHGYSAHQPRLNGL
jgi:hypothetical protein